MCLGGGGSNEVKETKDQKELAQIGLEQYQTYQNLYPDVENEFFNQVDRLGSSETFQRGAGNASANVSSSFSQGRTDTINALSQNGVNPNSGRFVSALTDISSGEGASRFNNSNSAQMSLQDAMLQGKSNIVAMGQGQETEAIQGFGDISRESGRSAINDAYQGYQNFSNRRSAIATGVGIGVGAATAPRSESNKSGVGKNDTTR